MAVDLASKESNILRVTPRYLASFEEMIQDLILFKI